MCIPSPQKLLAPILPGRNTFLGKAMAPLNDPFNKKSYVDGLTPLGKPSLGTKPQAAPKPAAASYGSGLQLR